MRKQKLYTFKITKIFVVFCLFMALSVCGAHFLSKTKASVLAPADINNDGTVNIFDLSTLLSNWGVTGTGSSDINSDNIVNIFDLSILLSKWGPVVADYNSAVLADSPVGFWPMASASNPEQSLAGSMPNGSYMGTGYATLATMPNGDKAVVFDGQSQYMTIPSNPKMSIGQQFTWEAWIRPDVLQFSNSTGGYIDWMGKCEEYSPTCEWEARMYNQTNPQNRCNRLSAYVFNNTAGLGSGADWQPDCGLFQAGIWLHVVGEYQTLTTPSQCSATYPGTINIWVNGVPWNFAQHAPTGCFSQYSVTAQAGNSALNVGTMAMDSYFQGAIGKLAIYDKLLTQTQITNHYKAMTGQDPSGSCANTCTITNIIR